MFSKYEPTANTFHYQLRKHSYPTTITEQAVFLGNHRSTWSLICYYMYLQCDLSSQGHPTTFSTNLKNVVEVSNSFPIQNDHKSVAFVIHSLITWIICWKTIVNLHNFYSLNLWKILSGGLGVKYNPTSKKLHFYM